MKSHFATPETKILFQDVLNSTINHLAEAMDMNVEAPEGRVEMVSVPGLETKMELLNKLDPRIAILAVALLEGIGEISTAYSVARAVTSQILAAFEEDLPEVPPPAPINDVFGAN